MSDQPADLDHTLYVIFHGALAFYDDPGLPWIDALAADMKDDHVYLCGKFLGETRIHAGSDLALSGVTPGHASFDDHKDGFVHFTGVSGNGGALIRLDNVYSRFRFPRPERIRHCYNFANPNDSRKMCIVPVFQYRFRSVEKLALRMFLHHGKGCAPDADPYPRQDTFRWKPNTSDSTPLTLHIRAEEDRQESRGQRDYDFIRRMLGDPSTESIAAWDTHDPSDDDSLPGFSADRSFWEIYLSLWKRHQWLAGMGGAIQRHPTPPGDSFVVTAPVAFKDDNVACGPASGGAGGNQGG